MQCAKLADVLQYAAQMWRTHELDITIAVLRHAGTATVAATRKKLLQQLETEPAHPTAASAHLNDLAELMLRAGAKGSHADLTDLSNIAERFSGKTKEELISLLKTPAKKKAAKTIDRQLIRQIADRLTAAELDSDAFAEALTEAKKLTKPGLEAVALEFLGHPGSYKSKREIVDAINNRHKQDIIQESRNKRLESLSAR